VVRIISGEQKGRRLSTLKGRSVRPTSDRAKETLFDILSDRVEGSRFLDLFAGTGSVGLEAASRDAEQVFLVESDPRALKILQKNIDWCGLMDKVTVFRTDAKKSLSRLASDRQTFSLIFLDPPYHDRLAYALISEVGEKGLLEDGGMVIAEHDRHHSLPEVYGTLSLVRTRQVGDTLFSFYGGPCEG
jgi:16S rRNA (guanine966-N2)-methyltransferase